MPPISFYVPEDDWPEDIDKENPQYRWSTRRAGKWNWTFQTFQHLNAHGIDCTMTSDLSTDGILFAHRSVLPKHHFPHSDQLLVCILAERVRHRFAQYHLLQDPTQARLFSGTWNARCDRVLLGRTSEYIRYWPQPGLIGRDEQRGDTFEHVVFKGMPQQLAEEVQTESFRAQLEELGLRWDIQHDKERWPDYSDVDAVLAIRSFQLPAHSRKPATKLYNAWLAGVPALLGPEPAFRHEGTPGEDYLEPQNVTDVVTMLRQLKDDVALRRRLVAAGREQTDRYQVQQLVGDWKQLIDERLTPLLAEWKKSSSRRRMFHAYRLAFFLSRSVGRRVWPWFNLYT